MERLGAVARLEQERAPCRDVCKCALHLPRLAGEDERRERVETLPDARYRVCVWPLGLLERLSLPPGRRGPGRIEDRHCDLV